MKIANLFKNILEKIKEAETKKIVSAAWSAASSASSSTHLTDSATLSKGKWIACIQFPICSSTMGARLNTESGTTTLSNSWYMQGESQQSITRIFEVTSATASVYLGSAQSASVTFSSTERGGLQLIRVGGVTNPLTYLSSLLNRKAVMA